MGETANGDPLSLAAAVKTIDRASQYEEPLRRRTEGVTWMVWGIVTAAIQLSFSATQDFFANPEATPWWWTAIPVLGWPLVGVVTTYAIWSVAGLNAPGLLAVRRRSFIAALLWLPLLYASDAAVWIITYAADVEVSGAVYPLLGLGGAWVLLGATNLWSATAMGRRLVLGFGGFILLTGIVLAALVSPDPHTAWRTTPTFTVLVGGGAPFLCGLWQTLRG